MSQPLADMPRQHTNETDPTNRNHGSIQVEQSPESINTNQTNLEMSALVGDMKPEGQGHSSAEVRPVSNGDSSIGVVKLDRLIDEKETTDVETTKITLSGQCLTTFPRHLLDCELSCFYFRCEYSQTTLALVVVMLTSSAAYHQRCSNIQLLNGLLVK